MLKKIAAIIEEQLGTVSACDITEETSFQKDLNADSLDLYELVMKCEEEYDIEFPSEDLEKIKTVGDVMNFIKEQGIEA